jgi:hypothetical protein
MSPLMPSIGHDAVSAAAWFTLNFVMVGAVLCVAPAPPAVQLVQPAVCDANELHLRPR